MTQNTTNVTDEGQKEELVNSQPEEISEGQDLKANSQKQDDKDYNFAQLRKGKEQLEKQVKELQGDVQNLQKTSAPPAESEEDFGMDDEDIVEGKHFKKVTQELRLLKQQMLQEKSLNVQERLNTRFSDFNKVVTKENIEKLKTNEPELYTSIISSQDLFAKGVSAYKTLKALGIVEEDFTQTKEQVQNNHNRPLSAQAIKGQSALSDTNVFAGGLTPELQKQLRKEMADAVKAR